MHNLRTFINDAQKWHQLKQQDLFGFRKMTFLHLIELIEKSTRITETWQPS